MEPQIMTARQHRLANGMTIRTLAEKAGISTQTVVAIEKGRNARIQSFQAVADVFGVDLMAIREYRQIVLDASASTP